MVEGKATADSIVQSVKENYDRLAEEYTSHLFHELASKPFDREQLSRFATSVKQLGRVCDMGCGPGHVARYLCDAGVNVFGLDLSPRMIEQAKRLNPDIAFQEGDMMTLPLPENTLAGIAAFYAIVNTPGEFLPTVFREMHRVLKPGGLLLLAFHIGNEALRPSELWGKTISLDFFFFDPTTICQQLTTVGLMVEELLEREPYAPDVEYQSRRAYIFVRKPVLSYCGEPTTSAPGD